MKRAMLCIASNDPDESECCISLTGTGRRRQGDLNCDGVINSFDIDPFVNCLTSGTPVEGCSCDLADMNCDGSVNSFDIDPFVRCLTGIECPPCPCP